MKYEKIATWNYLDGERKKLVALMTSIMDGNVTDAQKEGLLREMAIDYLEGKISKTVKEMEDL